MGSPFCQVLEHAYKKNSTQIRETYVETAELLLPSWNVIVAIAIWHTHYLFYMARNLKALNYENY
jgi:hypothetical protein